MLVLHQELHTAALLTTYKAFERVWALADVSRANHEVAIVMIVVKWAEGRIVHALLPKPAWVAVLVIRAQNVLHHLNDVGSVFYGSYYIV